jgi:hypothetical protein
MSIVQSVKRNTQIRGTTPPPCSATGAAAGASCAIGWRGWLPGSNRWVWRRAAGDRVAILALNSDRYLETYVAVPWAGAAVVPLNIRWSTAENAYALNDSGATVLFVDDAFLAQVVRLRGEVGTLRSVVYMGERVPRPVSSATRL